MIGIVEVQRSKHLFAQNAQGIGIDGGTPLFQNDFALGVDLVGEQPQVHHAIRFQLHHSAQMLLGDAFVIARRIQRGRGIVATP